MDAFAYICLFLCVCLCETVKDALVAIRSEIHLFADADFSLYLRYGYRGHNIYPY